MLKVKALSSEDFALLPIASVTLRATPHQRAIALLPITSLRRAVCLADAGACHLSRAYGSRSRRGDRTSEHRVISRYRGTQVVVLSIDGARGVW
jgi:hypothetical protein